MCINFDSLYFIVGVFAGFSKLPKEAQANICKMVRLHVKRGDESQFLIETTVAEPTNDLIQLIARLYNGRLKVLRICDGNLSNMHFFIIVIFCIVLYM